jgi:predicted ATPase
MDIYIAEENGDNEPPKLGQLILQRHGWDDYGFKTRYHLYYYGATFEGFIGQVKVLKRGQVETSKSILPVGPHSALGADFCSIGQSLDYYERLAALPELERLEILQTLRDAIRYPEAAAQFHSENGWGTSATRYLDKDFIPLASVLLERDYDALVSLDVKLRFSSNGWSNSLDLNFSGPPPAKVPFPRNRPSFSPLFTHRPKAPVLPERVAVLTGRNGSGKSTLLFRLARVLHASQGDRSKPLLTNLGTIEPPGIGFSRVITVSYSAFDTFQVPGVDAVEQRQIIKDIQSGSGRYVFAGLRDIGRELEEKLSAADPDTGDQHEADDEFSVDRQNTTFLKSAAKLADEFVRSIERISEANRTPVLLKVLKILFSDASFADVSGQTTMGFLQLDLRKSFMSWSTGHKIVLHALVTLVANALPKSIALIDEPESHLHPPLLAAFMHALRTVLQEYDSFALIATHSPVVAQESLRRHVSVVSRLGGEPTISPPRVETYGESIGTITNEVFGLHADATDYHTTLRAMVDVGYSLEQIESNFERGMSLQARAYVMSMLAGRQD